MSAIVRLFGATDRLYVVERGVLDDRARLAFTNGQCHGMALALRHRTGLPLVAVDSAAGVREHVGVRGGHRTLIDVMGAHDTTDVLLSGKALREIDEAAITDLESDHDWAKADAEACGPWVDEVLQRAAAGEVAPPLSPFRRSVEATCGYALHIEWYGETSMNVFVRRSAAAASEWTLYAPVYLPLDAASGRHVINFTREEFEQRSAAWADNQFDPNKAERRLSGERA